MSEQNKRSLDPDPESTAHTLRVAIPLMAKHKVATTPQNFAIWYHYVLGDKPGLKEKIDKLIGDSAAFDEEINRALYQEYLSECNLEQAERIRQEIQEAVSEAAITLQSTGSDANRYGEVLGRFDAGCSTADSIADIHGLLSEVVEETRHMKEAMARMKREFELKSVEMENLRKELEQVRLQASTDALTGLANRATFFDRLRQTVEEAEKEREYFCVVMADIDHFKRVNDTFGHLVGDKVIRFVAETLKQSLKGQDTAARYGGEEFALLLPNTSAENAVVLCDKIRNHIANTNLVRTGTRESLGQITISAGVAQYRFGEEMMDFMQRADQALYVAKENGRNRVVKAS
ncbi:MAG TPA: GGDEF domain-containing protein [Sedimenticola thiotaurini]|uniref:diguanylate cyclase n=1 Tax=Sedimenticola thiotaurini TaxID=1543721 RepID=A0A831RKQ3_9GAMM|nr:GGDEF domain-containing protein [Sedimenticola thiotaurini]